MKEETADKLKDIGGIVGFLYSLIKNIKNKKNILDFVVYVVIGGTDILLPESFVI